MHLQVVNYLLWTYATDRSIAGTKDKTTMFIQTRKKTPSQYAEELVAMTIRYGDVYEEQCLNKIFIKKLDRCIRKSMEEVWSTQKTARLCDLVF